MISNPLIKFGQEPDRKLNELLRFFKKPGKAFVPAAGHGGTVKILLEAGWEVLAVDNDPNAIKSIKNLKSIEGYDHLILKKADIRNSEIGENKFNLVIASNFFHFFKEETALALMRKIIISLRTDGILFVRLFTNKDFMYQQKPENFYPSLNEINNIFSGLKYLNSEIKIVKDDHPPYGSHTHSIFELVAKKPSKKG